MQASTFLTVQDETFEVILQQWDIPVGKLSIEQGVLCFEGEKHASARVFFEQALQPVCDKLIEGKEEQVTRFSIGPFSFDLPGASILQNIDGEDIFVVRFSVSPEGDLRCQGDLNFEAREWFEKALRPICISYIRKVRAQKEYYTDFCKKRHLDPKTGKRIGA